MLTQFSRTELLLGKEAMDRLANAKVAVFGIGGVGGYVCEALVRSGVGLQNLVFFQQLKKPGTEILRTRDQTLVVLLVVFFLRHYKTTLLLC